MKYNEVIQKLKEGGEIRYHFNGLIGRDTYKLFYGESNDDECQLHPQVIKKILANHKHKYRGYGIEGNEETGWLDIDRNSL